MTKHTTYLTYHVLNIASRTTYIKSNLHPIKLNKNITLKNVQVKHTTKVILSQNDAQIEYLHFLPIRICEKQSLQPSARVTKTLTYTLISQTRRPDIYIDLTYTPTSHNTDIHTMTLHITNHAYHWPHTTYTTHRWPHTPLTDLPHHWLHILLT